MAEKNGKVHEAAAHDEEQEGRMWRSIQQVQERNAHISPEVVLEEVTAEVEAVRQEMYEQRGREKTSRR